MDVTVAICTAGERPTLEETLLSVAAQEMPQPLSMEILVVDNSRGENGFVPAVVQSVAAQTTVSVRCVREIRPGLGFARNAALEAARGEIVAYLDDDALADARWAWELVKAHRETDAAVVGGRIDPLWAGVRPSWLGDELLGYLSLLDRGPQRQICHYPSYPYGANISFRRDILQRLGGFATVLGVGGTPGYSMEETEMCLRVERAGETVLYSPDAQVRHLVPAARLTRHYFLDRAVMHGRSSARMACVGGVPSAWQVAKGLAVTLPRVAQHSVWVALFYLVRRDREFISHSRHLMWNLAWMRESVSLAFA